MNPIQLSMNDNPPSSTAVAVTAAQFSRLKTLTIISLCLNGLILFFLFLMIVGFHRQQMREGAAGGFQGKGGCEFQRHHHHHHFRGGWGRGDRGGGPGFERGKEGRNFGGMDRGFGGPGGPGGPMEHGRGMKGPGHDGGFGHDFGMGPKTPPDPATMADKILKHLTKTLTLTDDQQAKIKPIIQDEVTQMQKEMEDQRAAIEKQIDDGKAKIKPILNADQQKQLDAMPMPGAKPPEPKPGT